MGLGAFWMQSVAVGGDEEPRDSGGERRVSEAAPGADRDVGPCAPITASGANGCGIKKLFSEEKRQISGTGKRHARKSRKRVDHQKDADFDPRQRKSALCANVTWNTCLLEFTVRGSITHGSSTGIFDEPRSVDSEPGHPVRSP